MYAGQALEEPRRAADFSELDAMGEAFTLPEGSQQERNLLQRGIARPFPETTHRHLDMRGARPDDGEGVRRGKTEVIVAVHSYQRRPGLLRAENLANRAHQAGHVLGKQDPVGVGEIDDLRLGLGSRAGSRRIASCMRGSLREN